MYEIWFFCKSTKKLKYLKKSLDKQGEIIYNIKRCKCAAMAQVVEHILGKDEVTSSSLVSSSKNKALLRKCFIFIQSKGLICNLA